MLDALPDFSRYTFGTMSLGRKVASFDSDLGVARAAMESGCWFHTSQEYGAGGSFMVLRHAFDAARSEVPRLVVKIRCDRSETILFDVEDALRRLGIERIDVVQLCRDTHDHRHIVDDFLGQGPMFQQCEALRQCGKVGHYVFEIFPGYSNDALKAVRHDLFDGAILYYNPAQRFTSAAVWHEMLDRGTPVLALRTLGRMGGPPAEAAEGLRAAGKVEEAARVLQLQPIYEASAAPSWCVFCMRFALSVPTVRTTIGGTSNLQHLQEFLAAAEDATPLDGELIRQIDALHHE